MAIYKRQRVSRTTYAAGGVRSFRSRNRKRMYKSKRRFKSKTGYGSRLGRASKRALGTEIMNRAEPTRVLTKLNLTSIPKGTGITERSRDVVDLRGYKLCMHVRNDKEEPTYFHWAIVQPKNDVAVAVNDFFRTEKAGAGRGLTFGTALTATEFHCLNINLDRFTVFRHRRYIIPPKKTGITYNSDGSPNWKNITDWINIRRRLRFDRVEDDTTFDTVCQRPIFLIYWCDGINAIAGSSAVTNQITLNHKVVTYFKDVL